jgi:transcriptional regulator with XRE-family HTH domain
MVFVGNYMDGIARLVAEAMEGRMSQAELAEATGIPQSTLQGRLTGAREFTFRELALIAAALEVPPSSLIPEEFTANSDGAAKAAA